VDISSFAERIRDQRFDGFTDTGLADEIVKFQGGDGIGSVSGAVDALKAIAGALAETDTALRSELGKLGVEWQSTAGGKAGEVFTEQAGFSQDAEEKVSHSAEMIFAQGEAFNRTLYKLPDPEAVRAGAGGLTLTDSLASLIGFETDHATKVAAANNARAQALEALNAYATDSGDYLSSSQAITGPQSLKLDSGAGSADPMALGGSAVDFGGDAANVGGTGSTGSTTAAHADAPLNTQPIAHPARYVAPAPHEAVTPPMGFPAPSTGSRSAPRPQPGATTPSSTYTPPSSGASPATTPIPTGRSGLAPGVVVGAAGQPEASRTGGFGAPQNAFTSTGSPINDVLGNAPAARPGLGSGATAGAELGPPKLVGAGPQAPAPPAEIGGTFPAAARGGPAPGEFGAGATAVGAGGAGGAVSGEKERQGRGFGRDKLNDGRTLNRLPMDELPEEEATAARNAGKLAPPARENPGFLEAAAPQQDDANHVRRFGVDDKDLFSDPRPVSPDVLRGTGETD
jgi:hypothetical protein